MLSCTVHVHTEYDRARTAAGLYGFLVPNLVHSAQAQVLSAGGPKARLRFLTWEVLNARPELYSTLYSLEEIAR